MKYIAITLTLTCIGIILTPYVQQAWHWMLETIQEAYKINGEIKEDNES